MKKALERLITTRCEEELLKNGEYLELQKALATYYSAKDIDAYSETSLKMQEIIEKTCYKVAVKDIYSLIT